MKKIFARFSRRMWVIIGVILAVLLIFLFTRSRGNAQPLFQTDTVKRGNLVATVGATGTVRAKQSAVLMWQTAGTVHAVNVKIGDHVTRDQVLAGLDMQSLGQNIILAQADLVNAQKALNDLKNSDTAGAQAARDLDNAQTAYTKAYNYRMSLNGKIDITDTYIDRGVVKVHTYKGYADAETIKVADQKLALTKAQLDDARRAYDRLKNGPNPEDIAAAEARVAAAQATLNMANIIAPFDGIVTQASSTVGDQVTAGTTAFRVDDLSHLLVDLQVSEVDINHVALNQPATLTFDAILNKEYHGKVVQVGQAGDTIQGVVNFMVTVELTDADELVKPGMTSAVNIVVQQVNDALLIPNRAVRLVNNERVVYLLVNDKPVKVPVQLGVSSDISSALASGNIKEGDQIILNPPTAFGGPFGG